MRVTIKDIAKALDISPATVSRALKNDSRITVDVRERVNSTAQTEGPQTFRPMRTWLNEQNQQRHSRLSPIQG
jgi:plasmid maintenance system antidote protein VapI